MERRNHPNSLAFGMALAGVAVGLCIVGAQEAARRQIGLQPDGSYLVSTNQSISPIGKAVRIEGSRPKDMAVSPDGKLVAVLSTGKILVYAPDGTLQSEIRHTNSELGIAWSANGKTLYASSNTGSLVKFEQTEGAWRATGNLPATLPPPPNVRMAKPQPTGLAASPDGKRLYIGLGMRNKVAVLDIEKGDVLHEIEVGVAPYNLSVSPDGKYLAVSNRGGEAPKNNEISAKSAGSDVAVDEKTDAPKRGSISLVETSSRSVRNYIVGKQPGGTRFSADGKMLYVANTEGDSLSFINLERGSIQTTLSLSVADDPGFGQMPTDLALSTDGKTLYVTCGGANAVAVVDISAKPSVRGYLPTGWFPIVIRQNNNTLFVASAKGVGSRPAAKNSRFGVHDTVGMVQFLPLAQVGDIKAHSRRVATNNLWSKEPTARPNREPVPIPERVGEPSVFKHVVYIIKENLTYDSAFGDMKGGNGDPSLQLFGEEPTINHRELARSFVLLDNTYTSGTNSADGHYWSAASIANAYMEQNYGVHTRSYPYKGGDAIAIPTKGFLWTGALKAGKTVRIYGEFVNDHTVEHSETKRDGTWLDLWKDYKNGERKYKITAQCDQAAMRPYIHQNYPGYDLHIPDQVRADIYLEELRSLEQSGKMPALTIIHLPNDHTSGTRAGFPTPRAQVADNDYALGRIVEGISKSRFWKDTLVLVIEDDSQLGLDHVDGHRTIALCISPYTKRGAVVTQLYNHTSFIRTIGLVLGIPALNRFDRTATPMTACFTSTPNLEPFTAKPNRVPLDEMNPRPNALRGEAKRLALASEKLNWSAPDLADAETVSRALWNVQRPDAAFPTASFRPNRDDD